jgi:hypothetical protein
MTSGWAVGVVGVVALLSSWGCGGDGGQTGSCGQVPPCGGDIIGSWTAAGSCFDSDNFLAYVLVTFEPGCPAGTSPTLTSSNANRALSASFAADGTYSGSQTWSGAIDFDVPATCLGGATCDDLDVAVGRMVDPANGVVAATCTGTTTCACSVTEGGTASESGTYTTSGSTLETTSAAGVNDTPYCVSGGLLHLVSLSGATVTSDVMLSRR